MRQRLRDHIVTNYMGGDSAGVDETTPLVELNIIDSVAIFDLLHFIRMELGVTVPMEDVSPQNFQTIDSIASMVERASSKTGGRP